jgi:hypothetical protein
LSLKRINIRQVTQSGEALIKLKSASLSHAKAIFTNLKRLNRYNAYPINQADGK